MAQTQTKPKQDSAEQASSPAKQHPLAKLREQLETRLKEIHSALPPHIKPDRFISAVITAVQNNQELLIADRQSLWNACMRAAQDGLLPDGREGAIVIYNTKIKENGIEKLIKKAQWMPMVFGIIKKIRNSGQLSMITARVVYGGDKYRYWIDDEGEHILYEPAEKQDLNIVQRVFAMARTKDGELLVEPLTAADIEKIRNVSRAKDRGPWVEWWEEMAKKSAIRRLSKRLPMSSELDDLIRRDDELYQFDANSDAAQTPPARRLTSVGEAFDSFAGEDKTIEHEAPPTAPLEAESTPKQTAPDSAPSPDQDPEGFISFVRENVAAAKTREELDGFFAKHVTPVEASLFPPDREAIDQIFAQRVQELG
ncbi:MAG: recombinase RecT [Chthoniobacterales bacterium]